MKNALAIAVGLSVLSTALAPADAQGTTGSTDSKAHVTRNGGHRLGPQSHSRSTHKKNHRGGKKGKKSSGGTTTRPPK
jgi:hypothetical protein